MLPSRQIVLKTVENKLHGINEEPISSYFSIFFDMSQFTVFQSPVHAQIHAELSTQNPAQKLVFPPGFWNSMPVFRWRKPLLCLTFVL
jgi:hypothetical protein